MGTGLCNKSMLVLPPVHTLGTTGCHCTRTDQIVATLCMFLFFFFFCVYVSETTSGHFPSASETSGHYLCVS